MAVERNFAVTGKREVVYKAAGDRRLFTDPDADEARAFFQGKSRKKVDKTTTVKEAVDRLVHDGDYIAVGGFGGTRIPNALVHEIARQRRRNLGLAGHTDTHDFQILAAGRCINRCDIAYIIGLEARGLSRRSREAIEQGEVEVTEWTNAAMAWRYKAAAMGLSFVPTRTMLGTDTVKYSAAVEMECPFTGKKYLALPALYPDVAMIHVHRADVYGNCQIDGIVISDHDLARAAKRLIITTERLIPEDEIRRQPDRTVIPYYLVDAVVEVPYGSYPANMPYEYYSDEEHLQEWLRVERDRQQLERFMERHIYGVDNFWDYIQLNGGLQRMTELRHQEVLVEK
ncbi:MAG: CoA transferase subunit A [Firmicutes bacterium]|nr:CoA transferase subunit A [Bacillota bacterium]